MCQNSVGGKKLTGLDVCLLPLACEAFIRDVFSLNPCVPQDVRAEISDFLQQLSFEVTRKHFNSAALQCELHLRSLVEKRTQVANGGEDPGVSASVYRCSASLTLLTLCHSFSFFACLAGHCRWDLVILLLHYCSLREFCSFNSILLFSTSLCC